MAGRPTKYSEELADLLCSLLSEGKSLKQICTLDNMPCESTVYNWLNDNETFLDKYRVARENQAENYVNEIITLADTLPDGPEEGLTHEQIAKRKLQIWARQWYAGKIAAKKYGDKQTHEHTGKDGKEEIPLKVVVEIDEK